MADKQISRALSRPARLSRHHERHKSLLKQLERECYIINLPPEILQTVFNILYFGESWRYFAPIRIAKVCRYWQDIVQSMRFRDGVHPLDWSYDDKRGQWVMMKPSLSRLQGMYRYYMEDEKTMKGEAVENRL